MSQSANRSCVRAKRLPIAPGWSANKKLRIDNFRMARQNEAARAADATACMDSSVGTVLLKNGRGRREDDADGCQNCYMMKINTNVLAKVPVWQGFSGRNRLNPHSTPRPPHPRAASF